MPHSLFEFVQRYGLVIDICLLALNLTWIMVMLWRRLHRHQLDVILSSAEQGNGQLTITVVNKLGKETVIRKVDLDIYSDDLNRQKHAELHRNIVLRKDVDEQIVPGQSTRFDLDHRSPERDEAYPLSYQELVSDLNKLGIEIAQLTGVVWDETGQPYRSSAVRIPVYQLFSSNGNAGLTNPQTTVVDTTVGLVVLSD